ncbi:MAG: hypothetical protein U9P79_02065 [Candidatus Cloacimonadota bacterium]|nr:hypothetical protein [Candidatus Cloacimonadota bacterium]
MKIKDRKELFNEIVKSYKEVFNDHILSVSIYGSAITDDFNSQTSNINAAIILKDLKLKNLIPAKNVVAKLNKKRVASPLFLSKEYIDSSLDTFPIEFLDIKSNHKTILGEDYFEKLTIQNEYLRLQAERELKGKLLILRLAFIENIGNRNLIANIVKNSVSSIIPVLKAILVLKDEQIPTRKIDLIDQSETLLLTDLTRIYQALSYKTKKFDLKGDNMVEFFEEYINTIDNLSEIVDKFNN